MTKREILTRFRPDPGSMNGADDETVSIRDKRMKPEIRMPNRLAPMTVGTQLDHLQASRACGVSANANWARNFRRAVYEGVHSQQGAEMVHADYGCGRAVGTRSHRCRRGRCRREGGDAEDGVGTPQAMPYMWSCWGRTPPETMKREQL